MVTPTIPTNEKERIESLKKFEVLDTLSEEEYDNITKIAAKILNVPICLISLVDDERQWFKSKFGIDAEETPRDISFCGHAINYDDVFVVENALEDKRFVDNPLVTDGPNIRFYAGSQLTTENGFNIGTLCAIDNKPRILTDEEKQLLKVLSQNVMNLFELRIKNKELNIQITEALLLNEELSQLLKDKEKSVISKMKNETLTLDSSPSSFNLSSSILVIRNSLSTELNSNNNKILAIIAPTMISTDKTVFEVLLKNIVLAMNSFLKNDIINIKASVINNKVEIVFKNTYLQSWNKEILEQKTIDINKINGNEFFKNSILYAQNIKASVTVDQDLSKGYIITLVL